MSCVARQRSPVKRKVGFAGDDTGETEEQCTVKGGTDPKESNEAAVSQVAVPAVVAASSAKSSGLEPCNATAVHDKAGTALQDGPADAVTTGPRSSRSGDPGDVPSPPVEKSLPREGVSSVEASSETVDSDSATVVETAKTSKPLLNGSVHPDGSSDFPIGVVANGENLGCRVKHRTGGALGDDIDDDDSPMSDLGSVGRVQQEATASLGDGVDNDGDSLMVDAMFDCSTDSRSAPGPSGLDNSKSVTGVGGALSGAAATLPEQSNLPSSGGWLDANGPPISTSGVVEGRDEEGIESMECDTVVVSKSHTAPAARATLTTEKAATSSSSEANEAVEACRAADLAAKRRAKVDARLMKRVCEQECLRLLEARDHITRSTQGWSVEQLLALRGSVLELGAALCGRGRSGVGASSISEAVDILIGYFKRRLP